MDNPAKIRKTDFYKEINNKKRKFMCPFCVAIMTAGATSAGGLTVFIYRTKKNRKESKPEKETR